MPEYYFDIETTGLDPHQDEIITIQFQQLDTKTGEPIGDLKILKSWELGGEKKLLEKFMPIFKGFSPFGFVPIGMNLAFDFRFLLQKSLDHTNENMKHDDFFYDKPYVDLKSLFVILNDGRFSGCKLSNFSGKKDEGHLVPEWFKNKEYGKIEKYIEQETKSFLKTYREMKKHMPTLKEKLF